MFILLDDGEALTVGSEEEGSSVTNGNIRLRFFLVLMDSLAGVIDGVFRTVSRAVAAQEAGSILWGDGGVVGFDPRPLQDIVRVLACSWEDRDSDQFRNIRQHQNEAQSPVLVRLHTTAGRLCSLEPDFIHEYAWIQLPL